tara:strand:+ start:828 stop:1046 length:219 start_codon:yes stop_codon:yes gene_type:complete
MNSNVLAIVALLGIVDSVTSGVAHVELTSKHNEMIEAFIPVKLFPCEVGEGDIFSLEIVDGVTEIRCGDPDA